MDAGVIYKKMLNPPIELDIGSCVNKNCLKFLHFIVLLDIQNLTRVYLLTLSGY